MEKKIIGSKHLTEAFIKKNNHDQRKNQFDKSHHIYSSLFTVSALIIAQNNIKEQLTIPLSDPNKTGLLNVGLISCSIHVISYSVKQIIVNVTMGRNTNEKEEINKDEPANRMRKLSSNGGVKLTA